MRRMNLIGERFGSLVVIDEAPVQDKRNFRWLCLCDCGTQTVVPTCHLRSGHTKSCGRCQRFTVEGNIARCTLPDGKSFIFDVDDLPLISRYSWSFDDHGYARSWSKEHGYFKLHRLLIGLENPELVDHINGDRTDNRTSNLRTATTTQNAQNKGIHKTNRTGFKGVTRHISGKYHARICVNRRQISLGYYSDPLEAALEYDKAALFYFGEYARTNFMEGMHSEEILELDQEPRHGAA